MSRLVDRDGGLITTQWMGRGLWFLAWVALVAMASQTVVGAEPSPVWRSNFKAALLEAEQRRLPLLVHFYADWCMPCKPPPYTQPLTWRLAKKSLVMRVKQKSNI